MLLFFSSVLSVSKEKKTKHFADKLNEMAVFIKRLFFSRPGISCKLSNHKVLTEGFA
jgi:hypothetical protein